MTVWRYNRQPLFLGIRPPSECWMPPWCGKTREVEDWLLSTGLTYLLNLFHALTHQLYEYILQRRFILLEV